MNKNLIKADQQCYFHPTSSIKYLQEKGAKIISRAKGSKVYDLAGKEYIDGTASLWYSAIGHGRKKLPGRQKSRSEHSTLTIHLTNLPTNRRSFWQRKLPGWFLFPKQKFSSHQAVPKLTKL
jgi:adenosylmethionine-8-amino-7-oxononanoate aminotransferase